MAFRLDFSGHGRAPMPDRSHRSTLVQRAGCCIAMRRAPVGPIPTDLFGP
jgi:hypothetical protein